MHSATAAGGSPPTTARPKHMKSARLPRWNESFADENPAALISDEPSEAGAGSADVTKWASAQTQSAMCEASW